jgi:hypothetical protein
MLSETKLPFSRLGLFPTEGFLTASERGFGGVLEGVYEETL